jgi:glycerol-3-phosphate dehydrogenase
MNMDRNTRDLERKEYDLVVVGGGIFGVCAAWDGALRGLSVALVEGRDFSHATSANHLKMVHGGIRYLQHGDILRIRESCRERSALLRIAPHLVRPLPVIVPTYGHGMRGKEVLRAGMFLYDLLTLDRNRRIHDPGQRIPRVSFLSRREVLDLFPGVDDKGLSGGALFHDGQIHNPPRLALSFLGAAVAAGADAANYLEVTRFIQKGRRVIGVEVRDGLDGGAFDVRGKVILNAAGPWAARLIEGKLGLRLPRDPVFSRDVCFVARRSLSPTHAIACQTRTRDADAVVSRGGRHLFLAPWRGYTLVGVWHGVHHGNPDDLSVGEEELRDFLDEANGAYPGLSLSPDDISMVNAGLILFAENRPGDDGIRFGKRSVLWDHETMHGVEGLVTLIGVRATTARGMARKAINSVFRKLRKDPPASRTDSTPICGGRIDSFDAFLEWALSRPPHRLDEPVIRSLVRNHGSAYEEVTNRIAEDSAWAGRVGESFVLKAEIIHAVRAEMARKLEDVVFRRTDLGTGTHPGEDALRVCAELMAQELGWGEGRIRQELAETRAAFLPHRYSGKNRIRAAG